MTDLNEDEQVLSGYDVVEWVDDVGDFQCTRCRKVLIRHYIANCQHKFCSNCKRILDDGSRRWRCPECNQFIQDMDRQEFEFRDRVRSLRLHCPNRKYGCQHTCPFKDLKEHLGDCEHSKKRALPVLWKGDLTTEMLERMFTMQMLEVRNEMKEMKQTILEMKRRCENRNAAEISVFESAWELSVEANEMKRKMLEMEEKQKDAKGEIKAKLSYVNDRVDGVKSDLIVETTRLKNDIQELKKNETMRKNSGSVLSAVEENKTKILKLEGKAESYFEMIEFNNRKNSEQTHRLKKELEKQLETLEVKIGEETIRNRNAETENISNQKKSSAKIAKLSEGIESLSRDLLNNRSECNGRVERCLADLGKVNEETKQLGKTLGEIETETKSILKEINEKVVKIEENLHSAIITIDRKLKEQIELVKKEMEQNVTRFNVELEKLKKQITKTTPLLSSKSKSEKDAKTKPSFPLSIPNIPQMTCFDLSANDNRFEPVFIWTVNGINESPASRAHWNSEWFPWIDYPVQTRFQISKHAFKIIVQLRTSDSHTTLNHLKLMPTLYYVLKDQRRNVKHKSQSKSYLFNEDLNDYVGIEDDLGKETWLSRKIIDCLKDTSSYNVNDTVKLEFYVEPPFMLKQVYSYDGQLDWAIDNYVKRKQLTEEELVGYHESPYFYTGPKGYRVQVLMFLDGYVEGQSGLRAKIRFLRGEFDQDLPQTFFHWATAILLNLKDPVRNITQIEERDLRDGSEYFIELFSDKSVKALIENDTLYYKVTIK